MRDLELICPYFDDCQGCSYQDIPYEEELQKKSEYLQKTLSEKITFQKSLFHSIVASPKPLHYRNRLDMKLKRFKNGEISIGFTPKNKYGVLPVEKCLIAEESICESLPRIKQEAKVRAIEKQYRQANIVIRTGDDGRTHWGGVGRKSTRLLPKDYFYTVINGRKIFYSLDTFFQANLSILPLLFQELQQLDIWEKNTYFYDLYGGVGFFSLGLIDRVKRVILIEDCKPSSEIAKYNLAYNKIENFQIYEGRVEDVLPEVLRKESASHHVAMIDPPRAGLTQEAIELFLETEGLDHILYLSCNPEALARDLVFFTQDKWEIKKIIPFDFFPRTRHLETLVLLQKI